MEWNGKKQRQQEAERQEVVRFNRVLGFMIYMDIDELGRVWPSFKILVAMFSLFSFINLFD